MGPAPAGTVRIGYASEPATLNPVDVAGASTPVRDVLRPLLPALFRLDARLRPQPELAARWPSAKEIAPDPFSVIVRLRTDARWSDGTPITATDVRFSWERLRGGPTGARYRFLRDVEIQAPTRARLVFEHPVRRWWALFSIDDMVLPAHAFGDGSAWDRGPGVSGGPFAFEGWTPGLEIRLRRNDHYWGPAASLAAIDVVFVPDDETRLQLLARGDLDLVVAEGEGNYGARARARGSPPVPGELNGAAGATGAWAPAWWELQLNRERLKARAGVGEVIGRALDRHVLAELFDDSGQAMDGIPGSFPVDGPSADGLPALPGPWPAAPDTAAAKAAARDVKKGTEILLAFAESAAANALARAIHFAVRDLGVRIEIVGLDPVRFERDWLPNGKADAYIVLRRGADAPDADVYVSGTPPARNPSRITEADAEIADAQTPPSAPAREPLAGLAAGAWQRAQERIAATHAVYPLVRVRSWIVSRGGVAGPRATGTAAGPLWNASDWRMSDRT